MQAELLLQFCHEIGIEALVAKQAEAPQKYHLSIDVPAGRLKHISKAALALVSGNPSTAGGW